MDHATIADLIESQTGQLTEDWMQAVRDDPRIVSDALLPHSQLIDHIPAIIAEICDLIRRKETPDVHNTHEARASVYMRFHQGYRGRDLVRELSLLRITLLGHLMELSLDESLEMNAEAYHDLAQIINLYIDEEIRYAIAVFGQPTPPDAPPGPQ